jgi:hypothetical protein
VFDLRVQRRKYKTTSRGQGVIEYAGALVLAAVIVAMGITVLPPRVAGMLQEIQSQMLEFLLSQIPS